MDVPLVYLVHDHHVIPGEVRVRGQLPQEKTCEGGGGGEGVCVCVCVCDFKIGLPLAVSKWGYSRVPVRVGLQVHIYKLSLNYEALPSVRNRIFVAGVRLLSNLTCYKEHRRGHTHTHTHTDC